MRTAIKADFLSSKSFLLKTIVNKGITRDFRSLFVTYTVIFSFKHQTEKLMQRYTNKVLNKLIKQKIQVIKNRIH